ncbi:hypothetical protein ACFVUY_38300 [Kitasatospora sp. NPDC058063]|uniref:hypothetical protein n=1 Tax=unclassified Kitasatospora TaxID=2633591 RepID=UPI0036DE08B7
MTAQRTPFELAHYYPGWIWDHRSVEAMKSLLLFFDGFALLLPSEHFDATVAQEEELAAPLLEAGLLHNVEPQTWLDAPTAVAIRRAAEGAIGTPASGIPHAGGPFLTVGHFVATSEDADQTVRQLLRLGVVSRHRPDLGPDMVDLADSARSAILLALGLAAAQRVTEHEIYLVGDLAAVGPNPNRPESNRAILASLVHQDAVDVGVDLSGVPLDEVLDFRRQHGEGYRRYARELRRFVAALDAAPMTIDKLRLRRDRSQEIADYAADLRRARRGWVRPLASLALAAAGAAWTLRQADVVGSAVAAAGAAAGFTSPGRPNTPFTYLFDARAMR